MTGPGFAVHCLGHAGDVLRPGNSEAKKISNRTEEAVGSQLLGLEARELDHLGPFFSFVGNELAELRSRPAKHATA